MNITDKNIDGGKAFDWGRTSADYAKYRDIYPQKLYDKIIDRGLCVSGQRILDVGTGTGVLPRSLYRIPDCYLEKFDLTYHEEYPLEVHFTRESWNGRVKACRGIGASLTEQEISAWEQEHIKLLDEIVPAEFNVLHYGSMAELKPKK